MKTSVVNHMLIILFILKGCIKKGINFHQTIVLVNQIKREAEQIECFMSPAVINS